MPHLLSFIIGILVIFLFGLSLGFILGNLLGFPTTIVSFISITLAIIVGVFINETLSESHKSHKSKEEKLKSAIFKGLFIGIGITLLGQVL